MANERVVLTRASDVETKTWRADWTDVVEAARDVLPDDWHVLPSALMPSPSGRRYSTPSATPRRPAWAQTAPCGPATTGAIARPQHTVVDPAQPSQRAQRSPQPTTRPTAYGEESRDDHRPAS